MLDCLPAGAGSNSIVELLITGVKSSYKLTGLCLKVEISVTVSAVTIFLF